LDLELTKEYLQLWRLLQVVAENIESPWMWYIWKHRNRDYCWNIMKIIEEYTGAQALNIGDEEVVV
jgi:hypothetical protein